MKTRAERIWSQKKNGAKQKAIYFSLTINWIQEQLASNKCAVTGIPFEYTKAGYRINPFGPHIDRIDPSKGYTEDNCRLVCAVYNIAKLDWPDHIVMRMARALVESNIKNELQERAGSDHYVSTALKATNIAAIARLFGVSRPTVYDWIASDKIPAKYIKGVKELAEKYNLNKRLLCPDAF